MVGVLDADDVAELGLQDAVDLLDHQLAGDARAGPGAHLQDVLDVGQRQAGGVLGEALFAADKAHARIAFGEVVHKAETLVAVRQPDLEMVAVGQGGDPAVQLGLQTTDQDHQIGRAAEVGGGHPRQEGDQPLAVQLGESAEITRWEDGPGIVQHGAHGFDLLLEGTGPLECLLDPLQQGQGGQRAVAAGVDQLLQGADTVLGQVLAVGGFTDADNLPFGGRVGEGDAPGHVHVEQIEFVGQLEAQQGAEPHMGAGTIGKEAVDVAGQDDDVLAAHAVGMGQRVEEGGARVGLLAHRTPVARPGSASR